MRLAPSVTAALLVCACKPDPTPDDGTVALPADAPMPLDPAIEARLDTLLAEADLTTMASWMTGNTLFPVDGAYTTPGSEAFGLPGYRMTDGPRGVGNDLATVFPVAMARAATWDVDLERAVGEAIGAETYDHGEDVILAPCVNVVRHPRWGRAQESYGEDPVLTGRMGVAFVEGAQEHVLATAKHFAANSIENTRFTVDVQMDPRTLHEVYLPHFRALVREADVAAVMSAYNQLNGDYTAENRSLLTGILKEGWGFQGPVMSDWVNGVYDGHKALAAGLDIEMPTPKAFDGLGAEAERGDVDPALVEAAARRIARRQLEYGLDTRPRDDTPDPRTAAHFAVAREAAAKSMVLLKNDGALLPLDAGSLSRVAVVGRLADTVNTGDTGSSDVPAQGVVTPAAGLLAALGASVVKLHTTDTPDQGALTDIAAADVAIVVVGLTADDEGEFLAEDLGGDRRTLALSAAHIALIQDVLAANPNTVVVLEGGTAITVEGWFDDVPAALMAWYPGQEGGHALADLLLGVVAPSGRLPVSVPRTEDQLPDFDNTSPTVTYGYLHGYRWLDRQGAEPRFPFGFGLSTTTFTLSDLRLEGAIQGADGSLVVEVTVTNTGERAGAQVVQVYLEPEDAALELPDRVLAGFDRVELAPGASATATVTVDARAFATWDDPAEAWVLKPASWRVAVGTSSRDLPLIGGIDVLARGKP